MIKSGVLKDASGVEQRKASVHLNPGFINVPSVTTVKHHEHHDVYIEFKARLDPTGSEHTTLKSDLKLRHEYELTHCSDEIKGISTRELKSEEKLEHFEDPDEDPDTKDMTRINENFNTESDLEYHSFKSLNSNGLLQSTVDRLQSSKLNDDGRIETEKVSKIKTPTKPSSPRKLACEYENLEYSEKNTTEDVAAGLDVVVREAKRFRKLRMRSVKLNVTVMKEIASAIKKQSVVDELQMQECGIQSAEIKQLTDDLKDSTVKIKKFDIGTNKRIEKEAMESIVMFVAHHKVNYLILSNCQLKRTHIEQLGKAIKKHRIKLQTLDISNLTLPTADGITDLAKAIIDLEVEHLIMRECKLDFKALSRFSFTKLAKLDLSHSKLNVESIKCLSKVQASEVVLSNCNITFEHLVAMKEHMEKVQSLDISYNEFTDEEDGKVIGEIVIQLELEELDICGTDLTEDTLEGFASEVKKSNPEKLKLRRLKLSENCGMGTKGLAIVGDIVETCKLQSLGMKNCDLSSPEISSLDKRLCELKLPTLKFLDLRDENKYTLPESIHGLERHVIDKKRFQNLHKTPGDECEQRCVAF